MHDRKLRGPPQELRQRLRGHCCAMVPGSFGTFGDPSVDVDGHRNFYFACLGIDALGRGTVQVNKSTDGGRTWGDPVVVQIDKGSDKEWIAVGPDPARRDQDNAYVTWTSFQPRTPPATVCPI
jgi:hypothetical protein